MKKEQFDQIYNNLKERVDWCEEHLGPILCKDDLLKMTLKDYMELLNKCKKLMGEMDKIYAEWYHIIGMGSLSAVQQGKIFALIKKFSIYRSDIKCLSMNASSDTIPDIPTSSTYKLTVLGNFTLKSNGRGKPESEVDLSDQTAESVTASKVSTAGNPTKVGFFDGKNIYVDKDKLTEFATWMAYYLTLSEANLVDAIKTGKKYAGIQWVVKDNEFVGMPVKTATRNNVVKLFAGQIEK